MGEEKSTGVHPERATSRDGTGGARSLKSSPGETKYDGTKAAFITPNASSRIARGGRHKSHLNSLAERSLAMCIPRVGGLGISHILGR